MSVESRFPGLTSDLRRWPALGARVKLNFGRAIVCSRAWGVVRLEELPGLLDASWKAGVSNTMNVVLTSALGYPTPNEYACRTTNRVDKNKCPEWRGRSSYY